jgi:hypothetical protein
VFGWTAETWTAILAAAAFVLSSFNFVEGWVLRRRRERRASLEVRWECWTELNALGTTNTHHRVLVVNHGPAVASDVGLMVITNQMGKAQERNMLVGAESPIPLLHSGQTYPLGMIVLMGEGGPHEVRIEWVDGAGKQQRTVYLSPLLLLS